MRNAPLLPVPSPSRLFDNWWERLGHVTRYAPLAVTLLVPIVLRTLGYGWE